MEWKYVFASKFWGWWKGVVYLWSRCRVSLATTVAARKVERWIESWQLTKKQGYTSPTVAWPIAFPFYPRFFCQHTSYNGLANDPQPDPSLFLFNALSLPGPEWPKAMFLKKMNVRLSNMFRRRKSVRLVGWWWWRKREDWAPFPWQMVAA